MRISRLVFVILLSALLAPAVPASAEVVRDSAGGVVLIARDAAGNVSRREVIRPDGSRQSIRTEYWPKTKIVSRTIDEQLDRGGRATSRVVQAFDRGGRETEHSSVSIDPTGRERGTHTRVSYDKRGRARRDTATVGK